MQADGSSRELVRAPITWNLVLTTSRGCVATQDVNPAATPAIPFDERCTLVFGFSPAASEIEDMAEFRFPDFR